jgi:hypothetical protein
VPQRAGIKEGWETYSGISKIRRPYSFAVVGTVFTPTSPSAIANIGKSSIFHTENKRLRERKGRQCCHTEKR